MNVKGLEQYLEAQRCLDSYRHGDIISRLDQIDIVISTLNTRLDYIVEVVQEMRSERMCGKCSC